MTLKVLIIGDTNDGDYISKESIIHDFEELVYIRRVAEVVKNKVVECGHNWPSSEYSKETPFDIYKDDLTEEEIERFYEYIPYGQYGIHTIEKIEIREVEVKGILL